MELRAAVERGTQPLRAPWALRRRVHARGRRSGLRCGARRTDVACRQEPGAAHGRAILDARDDPRLRAGEAGRCTGRGRRAARFLLPGACRTRLDREVRAGGLLARPTRAGARQSAGRARLADRARLRARAPARRVPRLVVVETLALP